MAGRGGEVVAPFPTNELLRWYRRNQRRLPWRASGGAPDPWAVWVSEVMLQQTKVATVVPYFERFLRQYPAPSALAGAREAEALSHWSGLGYYARLRNLRAGAAVVAERLARGEAYPRTAVEWREIPGVGEYTAAAIASIAFGEPQPAIDGNVARVVVRVLGLPIDSRAARRDPRVRELLWRVLPRRRPGDFNQAMMELGATLCVPRAPACVRCPLSVACTARLRGLVNRLPKPAPRRRTQKICALAFRIQRRGRWLLRQRSRSDSSLLLPSTSPGLYEPLILPAAEHESVVAAIPRLDPRLRRRIIVCATRPGHIRHTVLHYRIAVDIVDARLIRNTPPPPMVWATPGDSRFPLTGLARKILGSSGQQKTGPEIRRFRR